ncbi:MAG: hypothetical protein AB1791_21205 [Chloroflexota bacterium]
MSQPSLLYRLQQIDTETRQKKTRLGEVLKAQKESEKLVEARGRAATVEATLHKWQTRQRDLNLELSGLDTKARQSENRLYSGLVKNPKELSDLQREIESLGRRRTHLEDEILEAMIEVEAAQEEKTAADQHLHLTQSDWEKNQSALRHEQNDLTGRLQELAHLRQEVLPLLTAASLAEYEAAGRRRGGLAVVALKQNVCQGCQVVVPAHLVHLAGQGQLAYCESCGRILYPV